MFKKSLKGGMVLGLLMGFAAFGSASAQVTPMLMVGDQNLQNGNVVVEKVAAAQDGWVVVHESNADGTIMLPGIIGKTQVPAGESMNVAIKLDKEVAAGAKLWPMLHIDEGQKGTYEFPGVDVPVTVGGEIVMKAITVGYSTAAQPTVAPQAPSASANGTLTVGDQTLRGNTVIIDMITISQDGWVVVHESNADGTIMLPGIIGKTAIKAGMSHGVEIKLDKSVADGAKLWPMLHIDAGTAGTYEFPGVDVPVVVNGEIVMKAITVGTAVASAPGMPRTGDGTFEQFTVVGLLAMALLGLGLATRRNWASRPR